MLFSNLYVLGTTPVSLIMDLFRQIFFFLDSCVYSLVPVVYNMIFALYDLSTLFGDAGKLSEIVKNISTTVYSFLAIVMFFRTAVSLLTMLVDPNKIDDKEQGAKKIVVNIFLCLALIVFVPKAFDVAKKLQTKIMEEHIIEKIVVGDNFNSNSEDYNLGDEFALKTWGIFLAPIDDDQTINSAYDAVFDDKKDVSVQSPLSKLGSVLNETNSKIANTFSFSKYFMGKLGDANRLFGGEGTYYHLSYIWLLSTIAGIYVLWTFIKLMIDVAYRSIKFFVLELLAPVAIVSYIDPNSSKKGLFSKWLKETWSTYLSLFARVFVFAIVTLLLSTVSLSDIGTGNSLAAKTGNTIIVKLFYILALIAFLKNAPKFIDGLFGTTMSKDSDTKSAHQMLGGLIAGTAYAGVGGITGGVIAHQTGKNVAKGVVSGAWSGARKGYAAGQKGGVPGMVGVVSGGIDTWKDQRKKYGYEYDPDREKQINYWESRVEEIDKAKSAAVKGLEADNEKAYKELLERGASYNGRKYGQGLENDARLKNTIKKNLGGLTRDEKLHKDDAEYLRLRRLVYEQKNGEAIANRALELAKDDFDLSSQAYNASEDKAGYIVQFATETARLNAQNTANTKMKVFAKIDNRDKRIDLLSSETGIDKATLNGMSDIDLMNEYAKHLQAEATNNYGTAVRKVTQEVSVMNAAELDARFNVENAARIQATYGHSFGDIAADAAKAKGDADAAQKGLDDYLKGKGKGASYVDSIYAIADTRHKAKVKEQERIEREKNNNNTNNNNNGNSNNNGTNP